MDQKIGDLTIAQVQHFTIMYLVVVLGIVGALLLLTWLFKVRG